MKIVYNNAIDWKMFGFALENFKREKNTDNASMARALNAHANNDKLFTESQVDRMIRGTLVPTVEQLDCLAKVVHVSTDIEKCVEDVANALLNPPAASQSVIAGQTSIQ